MKKVWKIATAFAVLLVFVFSGCGAKFDANKNVSVITRGEGSGTKSAFMEIIGLKGKKDVSGVIVAESTAQVLKEVSSNPHAIGFDSLGFVDDTVKKLKVDGVEATAENILSGTYKISRPLSVVYQESKLNDVNQAFLDFLKSADAQTIIDKNGYVKTISDAAAYTKRGVSGEIAISGSTSLQPLMEKLAKAFEAIETGVNVMVGGGGSGTGYQNAENGVSDFGMISEAFQSAKAPGCVSYRVALDGIAVIVNQQNPLEDISMEQLKNIYDVDAGKNALKVWNQLLEA